MTDFFKKLSVPKNLLIVSLVLVLVGSLGAYGFHTSFGKVDVEEITFETGNNNGVMSGLLYIPDGCTAETPCPAIVLTHGYLNSKEMQDAPAIELSKRGYVVLATDMYDHGDSKWDTPAPFSFFMSSQYDAAKYMYDQDYVLKADDGDGMIAVSGHSMGGFSSELAVAMDEGDFVNTGFRKIAVSLAVGADFRYTGPVYSAFADRSCGTIAGQFDEFFFDNSGLNAGTVLKKDYTTDVVGLDFLGLTGKTTDAEEGTFYEVPCEYCPYSGERVIYTPYQTHPWNHFSSYTTSLMIEFYDHAFATQLARHNLTANTVTLAEKSSSSQTWFFKELFELIAMVGLFMAIFPLMSILTSIPAFSASVTTVPVAEKVLPTSKKNIVNAITIITTLISCFLIPTFMDRSAGLLYVGYVFIGLAAVGIILCILSFSKQKKSHALVAGLFTVVSLLGVLLLKNAGTLFMTDAYYNAPSINTIVYWALCSAVLIALTLLAVHYFINKDNETTYEHLGITFDIKAIIMSLVVAVLVVACVYAVVWIIDILFKTDFRFWTFAIKTFGSAQFIPSLKYLPWFFIFYAVSGINVVSSTRNMPGFKGDVVGMLVNAGSVLLLLVVQYGMLFATGTAPFVNFALNGILCFALVPTLAIAAIINRRSFEKTNNVWLGVFINALLMTIMTLANTAIYLL
ncbi:MAG: alpha/beta hydrolase [Erysipelotrichales bacterium]|nr:alpha/beta hydrolase [Erysipelotrichales bacterium]